jgi:hypothetical protein
MLIEKCDTIFYENQSTEDTFYHGFQKIMSQEVFSSFTEMNIFLPSADFLF